MPTEKRGPPPIGAAKASTVTEKNDDGQLINRPIPARQAVERRLDLLRERTVVLVERVRAGELALIDAVDMAQSAAEWSGLVDAAGPDAVQQVLAAAFVGARATA